MEGGTGAMEGTPVLETLERAAAKSTRPTPRNLIFAHGARRGSKARFGTASLPPREPSGEHATPPASDNDALPIVERDVSFSAIRP